MGVRGAGGAELGLGVGADPFHVLHEQVRLPEDLMIDPLQDEPPRAVRKRGRDQERVVDVAAAVRGDHGDLPADGEFGGDDQGFGGGGGHVRTRGTQDKRRPPPGGGCWPGRPACLRDR